MTDKDEKWALFWCSLLRPVLFGEIEAKEANRYLSRRACVTITSNSPYPMFPI